MNLRRGFRRIAVVFSVFVGLVSAALAISAIIIMEFDLTYGPLIFLCSLVGVVAFTATSFIVWFAYWILEWFALGFSDKVPSRPLKTTTRLRTFVAACIGIVFGLLIGIIALSILPLHQRPEAWEELLAETSRPDISLEDYLYVAPLAADCLIKYVNILQKMIPPNSVPPPPPPPGFEWIIENPNDIPPLNFKMKTNKSNSIYDAIK